MNDVFAIIEALALLTPWEVPTMSKVRIGCQYLDGGYVMADRFRLDQKVYSYGISNDVTFDLDLAQRGLQIFMYDHTISGLPTSHPHFHFHREGIAATDQPEVPLFSLAHHVRANGHNDDGMLLKIDVEGAEWEVLASIEESLLRRFEQIVLELHDLNHLTDNLFRQRFVVGLSKLIKNFNITHVHANNNAPVLDVLGLQIAPVIEISLLRKDLGAREPWRTFIPSELDAANSSRPDYVLSFFPFAPNSISSDAYKAGLLQAFRLANRSLKDRTPHVSFRGTNIAKIGSCSQSSTSPWSVAADEANRAVTADLSGRYAFHTGLEAGPWWQIDFGVAKTFDEIVCYNRLDTCSDRANHLIAEHSTDGYVWNMLHENHALFGGIDGNPLRIECRRTNARFVRLRLPAITALHLDGVEIYDWHAEPV